jgi:hypothetical protein
MLTMLDVVPTIVINSGVDWPGIAASISTGLAALAGIGGTVWVAVHGWHRDDSRAMRGEKRKIYTRCLAALQECTLAAIDEVIWKDTRRADEFWAIHKAAITVCVSAVAELQLVAPVLVGRLGYMALTKLVANEDVQASAATSAIEMLTLALKADLAGKPLPAGTAGGHPRDLDRSRRLAASRRFAGPSDVASADHADQTREPLPVLLAAVSRENPARITRQAPRARSDAYALQRRPTSATIEPGPPRSWVCPLAYSAQAQQGRG